MLVVVVLLTMAVKHTGRGVEGTPAVKKWGTQPKLGYNRQVALY